MCLYHLGKYHCFSAMHRLDGVDDEVIMYVRIFMMYVLEMYHYRVLIDKTS